MLSQSEDQAKRKWMQVVRALLYCSADSHASSGRQRLPIIELDTGQLAMDDWDAAETGHVS